MLIRGAERDLRDKEDLRAVDYSSKLVEDPHLGYDADALKMRQQAIVDTLTLKKPFFSCCSVKRPLEKITSSKTQFFMYMSMTIVSFIMLIVFFFPYVETTYWMPVLTLILVTKFTLLTLTMKSDPGYMRPSF